MNMGRERDRHGYSGFRESERRLQWLFVVRFTIGVISGRLGAAACLL